MGRGSVGDTGARSPGGVTGVRNLGDGDVVTRSGVRCPKFRWGCGPTGDVVISSPFVDTTGRRTDRGYLSEVLVGRGPVEDVGVRVTTMGE